jgi:glutathione S-transferase
VVLLREWNTAWQGDLAVAKCFGMTQTDSSISSYSTQEAYEKAVTTLFKSLDRAEEHLAKNANPFYFGDKITEADVRLYTVSRRICLSHRSCE